MKMNPVIHVEILIRPASVVSMKELKAIVQEEMHRLGKIIPGTNITHFSDKILAENLEIIQICDIDEESSLHHGKLADLQKEFLPRDVFFNFHVYRLNTEGVQLECLDSRDQDEEDQPVANHWILPSSDFHGLWESLVYEDNVKENLLSYMETTMLFSDCKVDTNIISWNRLVLLYGPPGTGKTSLCKALAHKLSIRMGHRYTHGQLVEINSHSLFSKYFSESGKLVGKMFSKIRELIEDSNALVFVLIDEVESLTRARESSMSGTEPSDMIRAVNSVLTEIDQIRKFPNVMILTTSNITGAIDGAFLDRADIKQYIGLPSYNAIFKIYLTCLKELIRVNLILSSSHFDSLTFERLRLEQSGDDDSTHKSVQQLLAVASKPAYSAPHVILMKNIQIAYLLMDTDETWLSEGLSGRTLRRIPFLAHALFIKSRTANLETFLRAMESAVLQQKTELRCKRE